MVLIQSLHCWIDAWNQWKLLTLTRVAVKTNTQFTLLLIRTLFSSKTDAEITANIHQFINLLMIGAREKKGTIILLIINPYAAPNRDKQRKSVVEENEWRMILKNFVILSENPQKSREREKRIHANTKCFTFRFHCTLSTRVGFNNIYLVIIICAVIALSFEIACQTSKNYMQHFIIFFFSSLFTSFVEQWLAYLINFYSAGSTNYIHRAALR